MKRILLACAAVAIGASALTAASPEVEKAIKSLQAVGADAGKLKLFCGLNTLLETAGEKEDPAVQKQIDDTIAQIGPDFAAAWDAGDQLEEESPDGKEFFAAVDALAQKCTK
jgi:hypothetical protein